MLILYITHIDQSYYNVSYCSALYSDQPCSRMLAQPNTFLLIRPNVSAEIADITWLEGYYEELTAAYLTELLILVCVVWDWHPT